MVQDLWANATLRCSSSNQTDRDREVAASNEGHSRRSKTAKRTTKRQLSFVGLILSSTGATVFLNNLGYWFESPSILVVVLLFVGSVGVPPILEIYQYWENQAKQQQNDTKLARMQQEIKVNKNSSDVNGNKIAELNRKLFELEDRLKNKPKDEADS